MSLIPKMVRPTEKKHARTVIKTMDLHHYKVGVNIPIIYLKTDPSRNMINVKSEMSL